MTDVYSHGAHAVRNRTEKATTIARWLWDRGLEVRWVVRLEDAQLRALARAIGVNPPSTWETWHEACDLLLAKAEWAQQHPRHPAAVQPKLHERARWVA